MNNKKFDDRFLSGYDRCMKDIEEMRMFRLPSLFLHVNDQLGTQVSIEKRTEEVEEIVHTS